MTRTPIPEEEVTQLIRLDPGSVPRTSMVGTRDRLTLTVLEGPGRGRILAIKGDEVVLGRGAELPERFDDGGLSRKHARFFRRGISWFLEDLGSKNGTILNGRVIEEPVSVADGDRMEIGSETVLGIALHDVAAQDVAIATYESSVTDVLTRVHNRRYFEDRLAGEMSFALRHAAPLSLLLFDVDHFKKINDTFGHAAGDAVLRVMAATVKRMVRTEDLVARYGGEEFAVLARGIGHRNAMIFGERVRKTVQACVVPWDERPIQATISIGVATVEQGSPIDGTRALVSAADAALYRAKNGGRNRVAD